MKKINTSKKGADIIRDRAISKSTAFTREERQYYGLRGLLPYALGSQEKQINRVMENIRRKAFDIERYIFMSALQDRNEQLYYKTIIENIEELLPIIYTPTVGQACKEFSHIYRLDKGFFITPDDKGEIRQMLDNWPEDDVKVIVVTDGSRILGLGDLGANGMGIPIGKLALYTAGAGIDPSQCMPIMLDFGTDNEEELHDMLYLGYPTARLKGEAYFEMVDEFITAVQDKYDNVLIQFEDFVTPNAFAILNKYRDKVLCFNDDIQGTASVALGGVLASTKISKIPFKDSQIMFLGAGSAATGIADLMVKAFMDLGLTEEEACKKLWFVDIDGLVVKSRSNLMPHNLPYAHDHAPASFTEAIKSIKPNILIGASGAGKTFTKEVIELMSELNDNPVIFALSNPTIKSECTAEEAYTWSKGKAIFASGSPFPNFNENEIRKIPGQGNNVYIFPGIGLGAIASHAKILPEEVFLIAAKVLAKQVTIRELKSGTIYPKLTRLRMISYDIALAVANFIFEEGLSKIERPEHLPETIKEMMYDPTY